MGSYLLDLYLTARQPRNFLRLLVIFMGTWLSAHWILGTDSGFGAINLILSCEATIAGAVMLMKQEQSAAMQAKQLDALVAFGETQQQMLKDLQERSREDREDMRMLIGLVKDELQARGVQV